MKIKNFNDAKNYLFNYIPPWKAKKSAYKAGIGLKRAKYFYNLLGNPQEKFKSIHVAGTSGKGSTITIISNILGSLGFKVGSTISPHLVDIRERIQINNKKISIDKFVKYLNEIIPTIERIEKYTYGLPTFFEVLIGLAFYTFAKEKVDYAVIETGMGGIFDATNTIMNKDKLVILTNIGLDHTEFLGKNIKEITKQKAPIIQKNNKVICAWNKKQVREIVKNYTNRKNAKVYFIRKGYDYNKIKTNENYSSFDFNFDDFSLKNIKLSLIGIHQISNASLALAALKILSERDEWQMDKAKIKTILSKLHFKARFEIRKIHNKTLIIDGAHNPQKMKSLILTLKNIYPKHKYDFLIAFKKGKDYKKMLKQITKIAEKIYLSDFYITGQDLTHASENVDNLAYELQKLHFTNYEKIRNTDKIIRKVLKRIEDILVITGSLYFIGSIYNKIT